MDGRDEIGMDSVNQHVLSTGVISADVVSTCLELMASAEAAYVTNVDPNGFPRTRAMFNLRRKEQFPGVQRLFDGHDDDFLIYFTTNTSSAKTEQISLNPRVSVYYCRPDRGQGLMLSGVIEIVSERNLREAVWQPGWERYYPAGAADPDYAVLRLSPTSARYYHQLRTVDFRLPLERS